MKNAVWVFVLVFVVPHRTDCGENGKGVRSIALAGVRTVLREDSWSVVHNPAMLALQDGSRVSAFVAPGLFGLKELRTIAMSGSCAFEGVAVAGAIEHFGFDLYNELGITAGIGPMIDEGLSVGLAAEYRKTSIKGYGSSNGLIITAGWGVRITDMLHIGFVGENILGETIGAARRRLPQKAAMGISYRPLPSLTAFIEGEKDIRYPVTVKAALEFLPLESLVLRWGMAGNPDIVSGGISILLEDLEFGYAASWHIQLGWTHQVELSLGWAE